MFAKIELKDMANKQASIWMAGLTAVTLAGCTTPDEPVEIFDPFEEQNRKVHAFNKGVDSIFLRPTSTAYGVIFPKPVRSGISNFANNIDTPRHVLNDALQWNIEDMTHNVFRFALNTTVGIGGLFDVAGAIGLESRSAGFGETLHVWGAPEGAYLELPLLGPSNQRDGAGQIVDFVSNPLLYVIPAEYDWVPPSANIIDRVGDRYEFRGTIDSILYESADSYAQTRNLFLQNRRYELGEDEEDFFYDPYEDLFDE